MKAFVIKPSTQVWVFGKNDGKIRKIFPKTEAMFMLEDIVIDSFKNENYKETNIMAQQIFINRYYKFKLRIGEHAKNPNNIFVLQILIR